MDWHTEILNSGIEMDIKQLCLLFEEELERQENVYRVCCAQGKAARVSDVDALDEHTRSLVTLMEESLEAEHKRLPILKHIVSFYQLPEENHTLSDLISAVHEPWQHRLKEFQRYIQVVIAKTQDEVHQNRSYMLEASRLMQDALTTSLQKDGNPAEGYAHDGKEAVKPGQRPAVLNALG